MTTQQRMPTSIPVWDMPVRVFHWLLALSFLGAYVTAESERWRLVHVTLGYTVGALVLFRLVWGVVGSRHARFHNFVRGPARVMRYLRTLISRKPEHHVGHNPAGAVAIVAILGLGLGTALSGWAVYEDFYGGWAEELHELFGNGMLAVVLMHIAGVFFASMLHRENLVRAMITGRKIGIAQDAVRESIGSRVLALVLLTCVLSFWYFQWQTAPDGATILNRSDPIGHAKWQADNKDDD